MPVPLTALFAASLYQVRAADGDAAAMDRALSLLARAAGGTPVTFEILNSDKGPKAENVQRDRPRA